MADGGPRIAVRAERVSACSVPLLRSVPTCFLVTTAGAQAARAALSSTTLHQLCARTVVLTVGGARSVGTLGVYRRLALVCTLMDGRGPFFLLQDAALLPVAPDPAFVRCFGDVDRFLAARPFAFGAVALGGLGAFASSPSPGIRRVASRFRLAHAMIMDGASLRGLAGAPHGPDAAIEDVLWDLRIAVHAPSRPPIPRRADRGMRLDAALRRALATRAGWQLAAAACRNPLCARAAALEAALAVALALARLRL